MWLGKIDIEMREKMEQSTRGRQSVSGIQPFRIHMDACGFVCEHFVCIMNVVDVVVYDAICTRNGTGRTES